MDQVVGVQLVEMVVVVYEEVAEGGNQQVESPVAQAALVLGCQDWPHSN